jgi:hypothetical protein
VQGRDGVRLAEAERPEHRGVGLRALVVDLVGDQDDRLAGPAEHLDDGLVGVGRPDRDVHDEQHRVGRRDGDLGLGGDRLLQPDGVGSQPPVSTTVKRRPRHCAS